MKTNSNEVGATAIGFLVWFRNQYKVWTGDAYYKIAAKYGQGSPKTCRRLLRELEEAGYIYIWNKGGRLQRFYLKPEKYNKLVDPYIFQKDDPRTEAATKPQH